ncbi:MAG: phage tail protein [Lachnospiraceae bacterium]|nr:phage tail protein [Lachnospiraceae bacterium]
MTIGTLGDQIVFEVTPKSVKTLNNIKWSSGAKYAEIDRYLKDPLIEFQGCELESITFSVQLNAALGVNPLNEYIKFLKAMRNGEAMRFVLGWKAYGKNKWVIERLTSNLEKYDNFGNLLYCTFDVTLKEYAAR